MRPARAEGGERMELELRNGDYIADGVGGLRRVGGREALLQHHIRGIRSPGPPAIPGPHLFMHICILAYIYWDDQNEDPQIDPS